MCPLTALTFGWAADTKLTGLNWGGTFLQANKMKHGVLTRLCSSVESAKLANQIWTEEEQNLHINLKLTSLEVNAKKKKTARSFGLLQETEVS